LPVLNTLFPIFDPSKKSGRQRSRSNSIYRCKSYN